MNGFLIAVLVILAGSVIRGYWRGFVRIAFSLVAMILMIVLVSWTTPYISGFVKDNTTIYEDLTQRCSEKIQLSAQEAIEDKTETELENSGIQDAEVGDGIGLPQIWVEQILEKTQNTVGEIVEESGVYHQVGAYIADWILKGISFFVAFVLISIILKLILGLLDIVTKLPVIKGANRLLGCAAGFVQGLLIVWLLMFVIAIACTSQTGQSMLGYIDESPFLTYLYQHNGILYFFQYMFG